MFSGSKLTGDVYINIGKATNITGIFGINEDTSPPIHRILDFNPSSSLSTVGNVFSNMYYLKTLKGLTFMKDINWKGTNINIKNCQFSLEALNMLFESLPVITTSYKLTVTGNPGTSALTSEQIAVATAKNWSVVV
jgi:hypothetical protein